MNLKHKVKALLLGKQSTSESYIAYLRKKGVSIGDGVTIYNPRNTHIDITGPHLLTIGNHVEITGPVTILTHDYSWSVVKRKNAVVLGKERPVTIGDNCFIGWGATILCGTAIGDNVIIGANSVVSGAVGPDSVWCGNPARRVCDLDSFIEKRKGRQLEEAVDYVLHYEGRFGKVPPESSLGEYFFLFSDGSELNSRFESQLALKGNYDDSLANLRGGYRVFEGYEDFLEYCHNLSSDAGREPRQ